MTWSQHIYERGLSWRSKMHHELAGDIACWCSQADYEEGSDRLADAVDTIIHLSSEGAIFVFLLPFIEATDQSEWVRIRSQPR